MEFPEPQEVDASAFLPEGLEPFVRIDTGLRSFILKHHQSAISARLALYRYGEHIYAVSIEHYGESPDDWRWPVKALFPATAGDLTNAVRDWYVAGFIEDYVALQAGDVG